MVSSFFPPSSGCYRSNVFERSQDFHQTFVSMEPFLGGKDPILCRQRTTHVSSKSSFFAFQKENARFFRTIARGAHGGTGYLSMDERYYSRRGRLCEFLKPELNFIERNPRTASTLSEKIKMTSQLRFY